MRTQPLTPYASRLTVVYVVQCPMNPWKRESTGMGFVGPRCFLFSGWPRFALAAAGAQGYEKMLILKTRPPERPQ